MTAQSGTTAVSCTPVLLLSLSETVYEPASLRQEYRSMTEIAACALFLACGVVIMLILMAMLHATAILCDLFGSGKSDREY